MIIKGNILNIENNNYNYKLKDIKNRYFPVYYDGINTHILNYKNEENDKLLLNGINYRLDFYNENKEEIIKIINRYKS